MGIFSWFKKHPPVLFRCTHCSFEFELPIIEVRLLEYQNLTDTVCQAKEPCHMCHIGFMIPVNYTNKQGKSFLFHQIKPLIKNLDPDTVMERIFDDADQENIQFFGFLDDDFKKH